MSHSQDYDAKYVSTARSWDLFVPLLLEDQSRDKVGAACRAVVGVLGLGFSDAGGRKRNVGQSMFMVSELCTGGSLREKVTSQMFSRKVHHFNRGRPRPAHA